MGDSFAMGEGVPYERTLFVQLARMLGDCEILNFGQSGWDTAAELRELPYAVDRYHCERALFVFNINDIVMSPELERRVDAVYDLVNVRLSQADASWWRRNSRLVSFVADTLALRRIARETVSAYVDAYDPAQNAAGLATLRQQFREMAAQRRCRIGLVVYPMMDDLDGEYRLRSCHERVVRIAREEGLPVLDLLPAFLGRDPRELQVHPVDHHPDGSAHAIAAAAIAAWIRTDAPLRR
jgi:hypothetical protein